MFIKKILNIFLTKGPAPQHFARQIETRCFGQNQLSQLSWQFSVAEPVGAGTFWSGRSRCEGPAPAPPYIDKTDEILNDTYSRRLFQH